MMTHSKIAKGEVGGIRFARLHVPMQLDILDETPLFQNSNR